MTFKKAEMEKTLRNGLIMSEMDPLNQKWLDFVILLGLTLHQFQTKLLLKQKFRQNVYGQSWALMYEHRSNMQHAHYTAALLHD